MSKLNELSVKIMPKDKWSLIKDLSVHDEQDHFIETSGHCFNDAENDAYNMKWDFYGIYINDTLIGFAMHGEDRRLFYSQVWLDRFMIDKKYQGKGYGKKSMELILQKMYEDYNCKKIYLSVHENNFPAIKLYEKLGFKKTMFKDPKGERIMTRIKRGVDTKNSVISFF